MIGGSDASSHGSASRSSQKGPLVNLPVSDDGEEESERDADRDDEPVPEQNKVAIGFWV